MRCSLNLKTQAVNKAQRQLRPEPYFPEFFKSRALDPDLKKYAVPRIRTKSQNIQKKTEEKSPLLLKPKSELLEKRDYQTFPHLFKVH